MIRSAYGVPLRDGEAAFDAGQGWLARSAPLPGGLGSEGRSWLERHFPLDFSGESGKTDGAGGRGGMLWIRSFDAACCVVHASQPAYSIRRSVPLWVVVTITHDEMARSGGLAAAVATALAATGADWSERDGCQTWLRGQDPAGDGSAFTIDHLRMAWWIQGEATANRPIQVSRGESSGSVLDGLAMLIEARRGTSLAPGACLVLSPSREGLGTGLSSDLILGQFADDAQVPSPPPIIARGVRDEQFIDDFPDRRMSTLVDALRRRAKDPGPGPDAWFSPPLRMIDPLLIGDHESVRWIADLQRDPDLIRQRFERLVTPVIEGDARAAIRAAELLGWIADHKGVEAGADLLAHVRKQSRLG